MISYGINTEIIGRSIHILLMNNISKKGGGEETWGFREADKQGSHPASLMGVRKMGGGESLRKGRGRSYLGI